MGLYRRSVYAFLVAGILALAPSVPVLTAGSVSASLSRIRIDNFGMINANYYRGAQPKGQDYSDLAALGVKTVIDLTDDDGEAVEQAMVKKAGMQPFKIPMNTHRPPTTEQLSTFLKIVNDPANQPVFVHCVGGKHRTGVMTAAYRMTMEGWTSDRAFDEMKRYKFGAAFMHPEFKQYVYNFKPQPKGATDTVVAFGTRQ